MSESLDLHTLAVRRLGPVFGLFFLAPFVGEFLLGNLTLADPWLGLLLAPLYGCGALLVRELGRRGGGGWPSMVLLAAAYALIEVRAWGPVWCSGQLLPGTLPGVAGTACPESELSSSDPGPDS